MQALYDPETRYYYHEKCAPQEDAEKLEVVDVDGFVCDECGAPIEGDDDPAKTVEEEEDE